MMNKDLKKFFSISLGIIWLSLILTGLALNMPRFYFLYLIFLGLFLALVQTWIFQILFIDPVKKMQVTAQKITLGDFENRFFIGRDDELGELADVLNNMSSELQKKISQIDHDKNELRAIIASMVEGVIVIGKDENIILLSQPLLEMLDLRSREFSGRRYWELIRNEEINSLLKEAILYKRSVKKEISVLSPTERHFSVQISLVLLESGQLTGVVGVFHDITELKRMARLRSEFVANVSHEFKTPLTTIKGFVETLKEGAVEDKERAYKFLEIIQKHTDRLEYLVTDLLSLSSLESKEATLNFQKLSIAVLIENVVLLSKERIENRQQKLTIDVAKNLPFVWVDQPKMEQALLNLLDNASKFTPQKGSIWIKAKKENGSVKVDFIDSGMGIETEHLSRIFERFYRVEKARSREVGGTGLGLSIVKHIIQTHNGKVAVVSEVNKGSTFSVYLPCSL